MNDKNKMYEYNKILKDFKQILVSNNERAQHKKSEYLDKIMQIFKQFVAKCQKQIDYIIEQKIGKLQRNYEKVQQYLSACNEVSIEHRNLVIAQFLIKPFEKFPFTGHKNQKLFKEQYNLIEKASVLIQQTLTQSFKEEEVPTFDNNQFFTTIRQHGVGKQSLTKLRLNPQNFAIKPLYEIVPLQQKINSIVKLNSECIICVGDQNYIEVWDIAEKYCIKKLYMDVPAPISTMTVAQGDDQCQYLFIGFGDECPIIMSYRLDSWSASACNQTHTQKLTKIVKFTNDYIISGSSDGLLCLHNFKTLKALLSCPHVSGIEDILIRTPYLYILQKNSTLLEYQNAKNSTADQPSLTFRRSISAGYISMIRHPEQTANFSGVGCHIYGLSQIEITPKLKLSQVNIINIPQMISDFVVAESKQTSQYFAICVFQSMGAIRIYSLMTQEQVYEWGIEEYEGQVGASGGYMPKLDILYIDGKYVLAVVQQVQFSQTNVVKCYELQL